MRPHAKVVLQVLAHRTTLLSLACSNVTSCYCHPLRKNIHISLLFSKLWSLTFPGTLVRTLTVITRNTVFHFSLSFSLHSTRIYSFCHIKRDTCHTQAHYAAATVAPLAWVCRSARCLSPVWTYTCLVNTLCIYMGSPVAFFIMYPSSYGQMSCSRLSCSMNSVYFHTLLMWYKHCVDRWSKKLRVRRLVYG